MGIQNLLNKMCTKIIAEGAHVFLERMFLIELKFLNEIIISVYLVSFYSLLRLCDTCKWFFKMLLL